MLHMVHIVMHTDDVARDQERKVIQAIRKEENISEAVCQAFEASLLRASELVIYNRCIALLNQCGEGEKLRIFKLLHRLANANHDLSFKKVYSMFYPVNHSEMNFEDVMMKTRVAS